MDLSAGWRGTQAVELDGIDDNLGSAIRWPGSWPKGHFIAGLKESCGHRGRAESSKAFGSEPLTVPFDRLTYGVSVKARSLPFYA
jgi:hypothetical protein